MQDAIGVQEAKAKIGERMSEASLRRRMREGVIRSRKIDGIWYASATDLDVYIAQLDGVVFNIDAREMSGLALAITKAHARPGVSGSCDPDNLNETIALACESGKLNLGHMTVGRLRRYKDQFHGWTWIRDAIGHEGAADPSWEVVTFIDQLEAEINRCLACHVKLAERGEPR